MRRRGAELWTLALLLGGAGLAWGQAREARGEPPAPPPARPNAAPATRANVEELLARALANNPDIRVASARVAEAEAELHRVRMRVLQKLLTARRSVEQARAALEVASAR